MRKHTNRKIRDPWDSINKRTTLVKSQSTDLGIAIFAALDAIVSGRGNELQWSTLASAVNVSLLLAERGICSESLSIIKLAQDGLIMIKRRYELHGDWRMNISHHIRQSIIAAIKIYDEQCRIATRAELSNALREIYRRVQEGEILV